MYFNVCSKCLIQHVCIILKYCKNNPCNKNAITCSCSLPCSTNYCDTLCNSVNGESFAGLSFHSIYIIWINFLGNTFAVQGQGVYMLYKIHGKNFHTLLKNRKSLAQRNFSHLQYIIHYSDGLINAHLYIIEALQFVTNVLWVKLLLP